ncbi:MAG: dibenzothiophene desulfurase [Pseudomonadota bacterium]
MRPASSQILFTTLSGLGCGLMVFLGLVGAHGAEGGWVAVTYCALALALSGAGLIAFAAPPRRPENALRAPSRRRVARLSREGALAVATVAVFALYAAIWAFGWARSPLLGATAALLAVATVVSTAMAHARLTEAPRWAHWSTPALFLSMALAGGALLAGETILGAILLTVGLGLQLLNWRKGDEAAAAEALGADADPGAAGDLGRSEGADAGRAPFENDMIGRVGRGRSASLRRIAVILGYAIPAVVFFTLESWPMKHWAAGLALMCHVAGVLCSRWLFYAEAGHVVGLSDDRGAG